MDLVELTAIQDALVGKPGVSGLSVEQRKRLTIAVELVANPSIVFMDVRLSPTFHTTSSSAEHRQRQDSNKRCQLPRSARSYNA